MLLELDFPLYLGKDQRKAFTFRNEDGTFYELGGTIKMLLYLESVPKEYNASVDLTEGKVIINIPGEDLIEEGTFEYIIQRIEDDKFYLLLRGNVKVEN